MTYRGSWIIVAFIAGALYKYDGIVRNELPMRNSPAAEAILKPNVRRKA